jgi:hypothetical protein
LKKILALSLTMSILSQSFSQTEKFDIASFIPPQGWQRLDSNGLIVFHDYKTKNNLTSFGQIILFPSRASNDKAEKNFTDEWNVKVRQPTGSKTKPTMRTDKTPDGWTAVTGFANITQSGLSYMSMLVTATGFGRSMSVMVNTAGSDHAPAIEKFFNDLELDSKAATALNQTANPTTMSGLTSFSEYQFAAPQGWYVQNNKDHLSMSQSQVRGEACLILVIPPHQSSGNLETDAKNVFDQMYPGWSYRYTGEKKYDLLKGYTLQGLEYCVITASMNKLSADGSRFDGYEDGSAMVIKNANSVAIISIRHNTAMMAHNDCVNKYETCARFFNSFTVNNAIIPQKTEEAPSKRIIGVWKLNAQGPAVGEYVFAANGNYQLVGAIGTSSTTSDYRYEYLHLTSYAFKGDGSYSINGNQLKLMKRSDNKPELQRIRFEKVNHGGTGWKDRMHMLKTSAVDGKEYEVSYEKEKG